MQRRQEPPEGTLRRQTQHLLDAGQHRFPLQKSKMMQPGKANVNRQDQGQHELVHGMTFVARFTISTGSQIARHLESVFAALPRRRQDDLCPSRFYCAEGVAAYANRQVQFIVSARETSRLVDELKAADWRGSPRTDADGQCEFWLNWKKTGTRSRTPKLGCEMGKKGKTSEP
jgi:hypothetical protein